MKLYADAAKTLPMDVSGHSFQWLLKDRSGATVLTKNNSDFVQIDTNHRKLTLTAAQTTTIASGIYQSELKVTKPDTSVERWQSNFLTVEP